MAVRRHMLAIISWWWLLGQSTVPFTAGKSNSSELLHAYMYLITLTAFVRGTAYIYVLFTKAVHDARCILCYILHCDCLLLQFCKKQSLTTEPRAAVTHHWTSCSSHSPRSLVQQLLATEPRAVVTRHGTSCSSRWPLNKTWYHDFIISIRRSPMEYVFSENSFD